MTQQNFSAYISGNHFVKPLPFKAHKIKGFSPEILEQHYEDHYGSLIQHLNEVEKQIEAAKWSRTSSISLDTLTDKAQALASDALLHEIYFNGLGEDGEQRNHNLILNDAINSSFASFDRWQTEFSSMGASLNKGYGWVVLAWSDCLNRLLNIKLSGNTQVLFGLKPILALDMDKHAYSKDFNTNYKSYMNQYLQNIHWERIGQYFNQTINDSLPVGNQAKSDDQISIGELKSIIDEGRKEVLILDVRHDDDRERYRSRIMETSWRDSLNVASWQNELPKDKTVVVYCMYGFWVSQQVAEELREQGYDARSLSGGITSWRAMGYPSSSIDTRD